MSIQKNLKSIKRKTIKNLTKSILQNYPNPEKQYTNSIKKRINNDVNKYSKPNRCKEVKKKDRIEGGVESTFRKKSPEGIVFRVSF